MNFDLNAILSLLGTLIGTMGGILVSQKLTDYRLAQLENKVDRLASKQDDASERLPVIEEQIKNLIYRVSELEKEER